MCPQGSGSQTFWARPKSEFAERLATMPQTTYDNMDGF